MYRSVGGQPVAAYFSLSDPEYSRCRHPKPRYRIYLPGTDGAGDAIYRPDKRRSVPQLDFAPSKHPDQYLPGIRLFYQADEPAHRLFRYPHDRGYHAAHRGPSPDRKPADRNHPQHAQDCSPASHPPSCSGWTWENSETASTIYISSTKKG